MDSCPLIFMLYVIIGRMNEIRRIQKNLEAAPLKECLFSLQLYYSLLLKQFSLHWCFHCYGSTSHSSATNTYYH
jgi:hypothetical protein